MISVCIATFNGEKYIKEQLRSILDQLTAEDEVIVSDDGSSDKTLQIIREFKDERIKVLNHEKHSNVRNLFFYTTLNFENALKQAKGDYIFMADQDDVWRPDKVEKCLALLKSYHLILHDCEIVDEDFEVIKSSYFELNRSKKGILRNIIKNSYLGCCMVFRRNVLLKALPFSTSEIPHDIWIGLIAEYYYNVYYCKEKFVSYRRHGANISFSSEKSKNSLLYKVKYRLAIVNNLITKIISG